MRFQVPACARLRWGASRGSGSECGAAVGRFPVRGSRESYRPQPWRVSVPAKPSQTQPDPAGSSPKLAPANFLQNYVSVSKYSRVGQANLPVRFRGLPLYPSISGVAHMLKVVYPGPFRPRFGQSLAGYLVHKSDVSEEIGKWITPPESSQNHE